MSSSSLPAAEIEQDEEEDTMEHTLLVVREVSVYKIPPRGTSVGYKCGDWLQSDRIWTGRLRVVSRSSDCEIRLEDPASGDLFAACHVPPGHREVAVEPALDSSRYFVIRVDDGRGRHAFVGLGFTERNDAFDFNVALSDHEKYARREQDRDAPGGSGAGEDKEETQIDIHPAVNHRLKEGEAIRINVKNKPSSGTGMLSAAGLSGGACGTAKSSTLLASPPTGSGQIRNLLPPPPNDPAVKRMTSGNSVASQDAKETARRNYDPLSDLSPLERNLPSTNKAGPTKNTASGWAAF